MSLFVGESLVGDGNEIAHIDLMIGSKSGPSVRLSPAHWLRKPKVTPTCWPFWLRMLRSSLRPS